MCDWKGEFRVDLQEWEKDTPTKKGISLTLMRWKNLVDGLEYADQKLQNKHDYSFHLDLTIGVGSECMDIREFWKPENKVVPTKKGLCLRP